MTTILPVAQLKIVRHQRHAEAALDGALLQQTGLLATLIIDRRETVAPTVGHAELMRLVKSQQSMLSACRDLARGARLNDAGEVFPRTRKTA